MPKHVFSGKAFWTGFAKSDSGTVLPAVQCHTFKNISAKVTLGMGENRHVPLATVDHYI